MPLGKHRRDHLKLNIYSLGDKHLTVGTGGRFNTIQAAIDYIDAQDDCFVEVANTHTDYLDVGSGYFIGVSISDWVIDTAEITLNLGSSSTDIAPQSNSYWLGVNSESRLYRVNSINNQGKIFVDCNRIEASIAAADEAFSLYRENPYVIELLDADYTEAVTINSNACIIFKSNNATWHRVEGAVVGIISRGANFTCGVIDFSGVHLLNDETGSVFNAPNSNWDWNTASNYNTIELRIHNGSELSINGSDMFSPQIAIGSVKMRDIRLNVSPDTGLSHQFYFTARGTVSLIDFELKYNPCNTGVAEGELLLFESTEARHLIVGRGIISVDDPNDKVGSIVVIEGAKFSEKVDVSDITIASDSVMTNISSTGVVLVRQDTQAGSTQTPKADPLINITNCALNLPNVSKSSLAIYRGLSGQVSHTSITNCHGGSINNGDSDVITCLSHDTKKSIDYAAAVTPDANTGNTVHIGDLTADITINAPSNPQDGQKLRLIFVQDATGGWGITWDVVFKVQTLAAGGASTKVIYGFEYDGANWVQTNTAQWL